MSDLIDLANQETDTHLAAALLRKQPAMPRKSTCYNCDAGVGPDAAFCDVDCRNDYERLQRG
jgi:hypothetical protein